MLLPTCYYLAHLCPLLEFVLRSLNTGHLRPEGEGVAAVLHFNLGVVVLLHFNLGVVVLLLSFFRLIRLLLYNRHPQQQPHRSTLIIWLLRLENSQMSLRI
jgi:cytochrome b561